MRGRWNTNRGAKCVVICVGTQTGALYVARSLAWGHAYLGLLLVAILALNVAYTGFTGLVSDMVAPEQVSLCSRAPRGASMRVPPMLASHAGAAHVRLACHARHGP